jgi:hypothetical protein
MIPFLSTTSLTAQRFQSLSQLKQLKTKLAQTGSQDITGYVATSYAQIPEDTWTATGIACDLSEKSTEQGAALRHRSLFQDAQDRLLLLREELIQFSARVVSACNPHSLFTTLEILQNATRAQVETCINIINSVDPSVGYLFNGAQTNEAPVDITLLSDLKQSPPNLRKGSIGAYFTNGTTPQIQLPLTVGTDGRFTLPLQANDIQNIFSVFYDFLSLDAKDASHKLHTFCNAMEPPLITIDQAILQMDHLKTTLEDEISSAESATADLHNRRDTLLKADPVTTATTFFDQTQAVSSLLRYISTLLRMEKQFSDLLGR